MDLGQGISSGGTFAHASTRMEPERLFDTGYLIIHRLIFPVWESVLKNQTFKLKLINNLSRNAFIPIQVMSE